MTQNEEMILFYGGFMSNWCPARFEKDGMTFDNSEQYFMFKKAWFFKDFQAVKQILQSTDPQTVKSIGRTIKNYDDFKWAKVRVQFMYEANFLKYSKNPEFKKMLLSTGDKILVEASPVDTIWGIGLDENDPDAFDQTKWKGLNLLGQVLMDVRKELTK